MYAQERHRLIVERARQDGRVEVNALATELAVTTETVRRDLTVLERHGLLRRVHGGAIPVERLSFEPGLAARDAAMTDEKERIAKAALAELPDGGSVILDAGTTTVRLAGLLPGDRELTVVTNALTIAALLSVHGNITVHLVGGRVRGVTQATVGEWGRGPLEQVHVDVAFIGTNGVTVERGLTTPDITEAEAKQAMIKAARHVVVLADHTKLGSDHFARFGALDEVDVLITDSGADPELTEAVQAAGPRVVRA